MKYTLFLGVSLFFTTMYFNAQDNVLDRSKLVCTYELTFQTDSTDTTSKQKEFMLLFIGNKNVSKFLSRKKYHSDSIASIYRAQQQQGVKIDMQKMVNRMGTLPRSKFNPIVIKNYPNGKQTVYNKIAKGTYIYTEPIGDLNWKITSEKKQVAGYTSQKALVNYGERTFEAWFTSEIPVSDGPYKFAGLPGLIVKIEDTRKHFSFELVKLINAKNKPICLPGKSRNTFNVSRTAYEATLKNFMTNTAEFYTQEGYAPQDAAHEKRLSQRFKTRNNTLEIIN